MPRKEIKVDPRIGNERVGLMITRGQVVHLGHAALMSQMLMDNSRNIIGFGSSQKSGVHGNPLTSEQKRKAQVGLWGDAFKMIFLQDIGSTDNSTDWVDYVLDRIRVAGMAEPTDFYAGSIHEARWYEERFTPLSGQPSYKRGVFDVWESENGQHRIHIHDREANIRISASEVRSMIERRDPTWRSFVPAKLWDFYEWEYPGDLRNAISQHDLDMNREYPVGTKLISTEGKVFILRDDGVWRERTPEEQNKSMGD